MSPEASPVLIRSSIKLKSYLLQDEKYSTNMNHTKAEQDVAVLHRATHSFSALGSTSTISQFCSDG